MKNYWLDKKEQKAAKLEKDVASKLGSLRRNAIMKALGRSKKNPCGCSGTKVNNKFLEEAKNLAVRWEKTGLLDGIKNKWDKSVTAVLLEGQRLLNEVKYNLKVRTKKTERRHGFNTLEELYRYIDMLADDMKHYVTFSLKGEPQSAADDQEMVLTIYENTTYFSKDSKILCPKSAGGDWDGYDEHRRQAVKK